MNLIALLVTGFAGCARSSLLSHNELTARELEDAVIPEYGYHGEAPLKVIKITRTYGIPVPVPVPVTKEIPVAIAVHKVIPYPVPIPVQKAILIPQPIAVGYPLHSLPSHQYATAEADYGNVSDNLQYVNSDHLQHAHTVMAHQR